MQLKHSSLSLEALSMAAQALKVGRGSKTTAAKAGDPSTSAEPDYLKDAGCHLRRSTDMLIVVQGIGLPCHKQDMAVHSKVFADMAEKISSHGHGALARHASAALQAGDICLHPALHVSKCQNDIHLPIIANGVDVMQISLQTHHCASRSR